MVKTVSGFNNLTISNRTTLNSVVANGNVGTAGQLLTSNGSTVYWSTVTGGGGSVNTAAQYTWSNTQTFQNTITFSSLVNASSLNVVANSSTNNLFVNNKIQIGTPGAFDFGTLAIIEIDANQNTYSQIVIQNANTGNNATSDLILTADTGNDSVDFIDFGINNSLYNQTAFNITGAKDGYLYASNGNLSIGTASAKELIFHANGTTSTDRKFTINATAVTIANTVGLVANGSSGSSGQVLTSNGSAIYWAEAAAGVNTAAQYVWTNTHTFSNTVTLNAVSANGSLGTSGQILSSNGSTVYWTDSVNYIRQSFTGDGTTTSFTVTGGYTPNQIDVYVNGLRMSAADVTISSGTSIVFTDPPPNSSTIDVVGSKVGIINYATVNTDISYTWTNTHSFTNTVTLKAISVNGSIGTSGQVLISNGSSTYWGNVAVVSGSNTQIQYNDNGSSNASAGFTFTKTTNNVTIANSLFTETVNATSINAASYTVGSSFVANSTGVYDTNGSLRSLPVLTKTSVYELASADNGRTISTTANVTVNGAVLTSGLVFVVYNNSASAITITSGAGLTMYLAGTAGSGNRTLAQRGAASILVVGSNTAICYGAGVS